MYVLPEQPYSIATRGILLSELCETFAGYLVPAERVETGYSSHREGVPGGFALIGDAYGALYGHQREGVVAALNVARVAGERVDGAAQFIERVVGLGRKYDLILADWWRDQVIDLRKETEVTRYILGDDVEGG